MTEVLLMEWMSERWGQMIILFVMIELILSTFTAWIADQKNRNALTWFFLGCGFGMFAMFSVGVAPAKKLRVNSNFDLVVGIAIVLLALLLLCIMSFLINAIL